MSLRRMLLKQHTPRQQQTRPDPVLLIWLLKDFGSFHGRYGLNQLQLMIDVTFPMADYIVAFVRMQMKFIETSLEPTQM